MTLNDLPLTHLSTLRATPHCSQDPRAAGPYRESSVIPIAHLTCSCSEPRKYWQSVIAPSTCCSVHAPQRDNFSRLSSPNRLPPWALHHARRAQHALARSVVFGRLQHVDAVEVLSGLHEALRHGLLARVQGHTRVVVLLVGLGLAIGVADLALQVRAVGRLVLADAIPERPLRVRVDVHL